MSDLPGIERCAAFITAQVREPGHGAPQRRLAITISRQTGAADPAVLDRLVHLLESQTPKGERPWTVFDKNLVARVLEDHHLSAELDRFMPEDAVSGVEDAIQEVLGLHPPTDELVRQTAETIRRLVELGNAIVIGRGANVVTADMPHVFHLRLVGSLDRRIERISRLMQMDRKEAEAYIVKEDRGRARYLQQHYNANVDDPLLYHLILNTDRFADEVGVEVVAEAALRFARAVNPGAASAGKSRPLAR
jgi:cytidylate kinase